MRAPVEMPRQEWPGVSPLERALGHLLSFVPETPLVGRVVHVQFPAPRAAGGPDILDPAADGSIAGGSTGDGSEEDPSLPPVTENTDALLSAGDETDGGDDGGESGVGAPDAGVLKRAGQRVLARIEDLLDLSARLEGAVVAATGQLTTANARLLLAHKGTADPGELAPSARERWAARSRSVTAHELSAATGWGIGETRDLVAVATAPVSITDPVTTALGAGTVPWRMVRRYWRACQGASLDVAAAAHVARVMFGSDPDLVAVERLTPNSTVTTLPWARPGCPRRPLPGQRRRHRQPHGQHDPDPGDRDHRPNPRRRPHGPPPG